MVYHTDVLIRFTEGIRETILALQAEGRGPTALDTLRLLSPTQKFTSPNNPASSILKSTLKRTRTDAPQDSSSALQSSNLKRRKTTAFNDENTLFDFPDSSDDSGRIRQIAEDEELARKISDDMSKRNDSRREGQPAELARTSNTTKIKRGKTDNPIIKPKSARHTNEASRGYSSDHDIPKHLDGKDNDDWDSEGYHPANNKSSIKPTTKKRKELSLSGAANSNDNPSKRLRVQRQTSKPKSPVQAPEIIDLDSPDLTPPLPRHRRSSSRSIVVEQLELDKTPGPPPGSGPYTEGSPRVLDSDVSRGVGIVLKESDAAHLEAIDPLCDQTPCEPLSRPILDESVEFEVARALARPAQDQSGMNIATGSPDVTPPLPAARKKRVKRSKTDGFALKALRFQEEEIDKDEIWVEQQDPRPVAKPKSTNSATRSRGAKKRTIDAEDGIGDSDGGDWNEPIELPVEKPARKKRLTAKEKAEQTKKAKEEKERQKRLEIEEKAQMQAPAADEEDSLFLHSQDHGPLAGKFPEKAPQNQPSKLAPTDSRTHPSEATPAGRRQALASRNPNLSTPGLTEPIRTPSPGNPTTGSGANPSDAPSAGPKAGQENDSTVAAKGRPDRHSPLSSSRVPYRVGLSRKSRITPLLKIFRPVRG